MHSWNDYKHFCILFFRSLLPSQLDTTDVKELIKQYLFPLVFRIFGCVVWQLQQPEARHPNKGNPGSTAFIE